MPAEFSRYHAMAASLAARALAATRADGPSLAWVAPAARVLVEGSGSPARGELAAAFRRLAGHVAGHVPRDDGCGLPALTDACGHHRDVYYPLAVHLLLAAYGRCYETMSAGDWSVCEEAMAAMMSPLRAVERWADAAPPTDHTATALWCALVLYEQGHLAARDVDVELADTVVHHVLGPANPAAAAPLHAMREGESLDAWTWRELTGLHALANLALARRHQVWAGRVQRIALYHQHNTQPDHVTAHPWALFAFLWSQQTRLTGEQQLHGVSTMLGPESDDGLLAGLLLADAAAALERFVGAATVP